MKRLLFPALLLLTIPAFAQSDEDRSNWLANPEYDESPVSPKFVAMSEDRLTSESTVTSTRTYAMFGFNTPEVTLHLPRVDNSVYVDVNFIDPILVDDSGERVTWEREEGIYDHDTYSVDLRFADPNYETIVDFAVARGTIEVRYPSEIETFTASATRNDTPGLVIDGPFVEVYESSGIAEDPFAAPFSSVRAYDSKGRRLARVDGYSRSGWKDGENFWVATFHGEVAKLEADRVKRWIGLRVEYELPPAPLLPDERSGLAPDDSLAIVETSGGSISKSTFKPLPASVLGWTAGLSRAEIADRLAEEFRYRELTPDYFIGAISQGQNEAVQGFLASGVSPDAVGRGMPALVAAAMFRKIDIAMMLLEAGADPNLADENGQTAIIAASQNCEATDLVESLVKAGANVEAQARGGATAMMMASVMKCDDNLTVLKEAGAKEWKP